MEYMANHIWELRSALTDAGQRIAALERLAGCPANCREDDYPGCAICMSSTKSLWQMVHDK
jgi:hypothetical protein